MKENFKILAQFIKDMSSETPDIQSYMFVKENIIKYQLNIDITSKPLKNKLIEVNTTLKFEDKEPNERKSHFFCLRDGSKIIGYPSFGTLFLMKKGGGHFF